MRVRMLAGFVMGAILVASAVGGYAAASADNSPASRSDADRFGIAAGTTPDGLTYGAFGDVTSPENATDLVSVISDDGRRGYVFFDQLQSAMHQDPGSSAAEANAAVEGGETSLPVYSQDGKTRVGTFTLGSSKRPGLITLTDEGE